MKQLALVAALSLALPVFAQTVCGPYQPFGRSINADGTWTITGNGSCQNPDPTSWSHTYTIIFPEVVTYADGLAFQFVGSAQVYIEGTNTLRPARLVTVDSASFTDQAGNIYPVAKSEVGTVRNPVDKWSTTTPLEPNTQYNFLVSGTDKEINTGTDFLHIQAIYQQVPTPPCTGDECSEQRSN